MQEKSVFEFRNTALLREKNAQGSVLLTIDKPVPKQISSLSQVAPSVAFVQQRNLNKGLYHCFG